MYTWFVVWLKWNTPICSEENNLFVRRACAQKWNKCAGIVFVHSQNSIRFYSQDVFVVLFAIYFSLFRFKTKQVCMDFEVLLVCFFFFTFLRAVSLHIWWRYIVLQNADAQNGERACIATTPVISTYYNRRSILNIHMKHAHICRIHRIKLERNTNNETTAHERYTNLYTQIKATMHRLSNVWWNFLHLHLRRKKIFDLFTTIIIVLSS